MVGEKPWKTYIRSKQNFPDFRTIGFFGVYDRHNGKETANYIGTNLHLNVFKKIRKLGKENIGSTAITAMTTSSQIVYVRNVGDSRAMMSVAGLAKPLSKDHKLTNDDEKKESNEQEDMYNIVV